MSGDHRAAPPRPGLEIEPEGSREPGLLASLAKLTPWGLKRQLAALEARLGDMITEIGARVAAAEARLDLVEGATRALQDELQSLRDDRLDRTEKRLDAAERAVEEVGGEAARLRDRVLPASVARTDALVERLAEEIEETSSLVERCLRGEPLPVAPAGAVDEPRLAAALAAVQPQLLASFRGSENEIRNRLDRYLPDLATASPVLDLGCGRGELLLMLQEAGIEATGVEADPALAGAARRRGLRVIEGDVLATLRGQPDGLLGAVTAIHLFEHLEPAGLLDLLAELRRVLRAGGLLIAECPNPHSLRVGAALFWLDPTHRRPLLPETLELFLQSTGFELRRRELLHPFPADQLLAADETPVREGGDPGLAVLVERVERLRRRLDELLNGPRDFAVWAVRPGGSATS
jgi:O-antigen chain-terminating methyltransferase